MSKGVIRLALATRLRGIRTIRLAGYDVYYEDHDAAASNGLLKGWRG